jgi:DNA-binding NarL/FixJ family response regulator
MSRPISVLLVDDHEVVRVGLRALLAEHPGIRVVGEAGSVAEAIAEAARLTPEVVLMDVRLPDGDGIEACRAIRATRPECRVVMLTSYADDEALITSVLAGACGYLLKQTRGQEVVRAIEEAAAGRSLLDPIAADRLLRHFRELARGREELSQLTDQERRVLELVAEGKTNREIGQALGLAEKTVKNYVSSILSKLQLKRRTEAAVYAARRRPPLGS